jgi:hypothetical protein
MKTLLTLAAALSVLAPASAAMAQNYTGNWPLTVTRSMFLNGTYCLMLKGFAAGGTAEIAGMEEGAFEIINNQLVVVIPVPLQGQNGALTFNAVAKHGKIAATGAAVQIEGGAFFDAGGLAIGTKGGC